MTKVTQTNIHFSGLFHEDDPIQEIHDKVRRDRKINELLSFVQDCMINDISIPQNLSIKLKKSSFFDSSFMPDTITASSTTYNGIIITATLKIDWI